MAPLPRSGRSCGADEASAVRRAVRRWLRPVRTAVTALVCVILVLGPSSATAPAFSIAGGDILKPWQAYMDLNEEARHEQYTVEAVETATRSVTSSWTPSLEFETDLVRG